MVDEYDQAQHDPPASLVPRLHCIGERLRLTPVINHFFTHLHKCIEHYQLVGPRRSAHLCQKVIFLRWAKSALNWSTICLYSWKVRTDPVLCRTQHPFLVGDVLAAEYLLLNMLSKVISRPDGTTPLGHLPVNLYHRASESAMSSRVLQFGESLKGALASVYPRVQLLKLTIPSMCTSPFYPVKVQFRINTQQCYSSFFAEPFRKSLKFLRTPAC